jgi:hypothetical protein
MELMPATNISGLVAKQPALVLDMAPQQVQAQLQHLEQHLPNVDVELLVYDEPAFLRVDMPKVRLPPWPGLLPPPCPAPAWEPGTQRAAAPSARPGVPAAPAPGAGAVAAPSSHLPNLQPPRCAACQMLSELRRLLPQQDPVRTLLANPGLVLDMDTAGQASSIEKEGELIDEAMLRGS